MRTSCWEISCVRTARDVSHAIYEPLQTYVLLLLVPGSCESLRHHPPHTYISTADFESPKELAKYLLFLDRNPSEYLSYFWWRDYYKTFVNSVHNRCILCNQFQEFFTGKHVNVYENFEEICSN